jgi:hypothetical protein
MNKRALVLSLVVTLLFSVWGASGATAKPVPGIKQTQQYRVLAGFVKKLERQRRVPATPARKAAYRRTLSNKAGDAKREVKSLFVRRSSRVRSRDDAEERNQVRNILASQRQQVDALNAVLASKLADLQDDFNAAVSRTNARYAPRLNPLVRQRAILRRQLARTIRPARREQVKRAIWTVQAKINRVLDDRQAATQVVTARYQARVNAVNSVFAARIKAAQSKGRQLVLQTRRAWKQTYQADLARLKERRTDEFSLVSRLRERGTGLITRMPPKG